MTTQKIQNPSSKAPIAIHSLGQWGEEFAARQLEHDGYTILDRNWKHRDGELDLVCFKEESLIFVEVKTRKRISPYYPLNETVTDKKVKKLHLLSGAYRRKERDKLRQVKYQHCRYDLFVIAKEEPPYPFFRHYEQAF